MKVWGVSYPQEVSGQRVVSLDEALFAQEKCVCCVKNNLRLQSVILLSRRARCYWPDCIVDKLEARSNADLGE